MSKFKTIQSKLELFINRYYTNELIKGSILFVAIGLLYFLFTLFVEHILWLNPLARTLLFWLFILVELLLFAKFIAIPLAKLFKLKKGIDYVDASKIIGRHFPEVSDKLLNVLQLNQNPSQSELLLASIEQKSVALSPVPFKLAVNFKDNIRYLKYAAIPLLIILITFLSGKSNWFSDSYQRVVHYKTAYEPPAPFQFFVVNTNLKAIENKDFILQVKTAGDVTPESAQIVYNNETYFLNPKGIGEFEYVFSQPKTDVDFQLTANSVYSKPYTLNVVKTPNLLDFEMVLEYPNHTKKKTVVLKSTGNAVVPEGTKVTWKLNIKSTDNVHLYANDTLEFFSDTSNNFELSKQLFNHFDYSLSTSNAHLKNYENLAFRIDVVKDEYPELNLKMQVDSLDMQTLYFYGQVSDDYGLRKLEMVYYPINETKKKQTERLPISNTNFEEFIMAFPNNLNIEAGLTYELFFQVFDNDAINKFKRTKSKAFTYRKRTQAEEQQKQLDEQNKTIQDLNKSLEKFGEQDKRLEELSKTQKEKSSLNFNDKKKLESFLKRQKQQDEMMKNFNKRLKDNLNEFQKESKEEDAFKEDLKKRLQDNEEQLKKDEKLLEELKKLQEKINKEELTQKLDELAKQNKNKKRSLQQLIELTKRFYVEKKLEKLKEDLMKLAIDQEKLSNQPKDKNTKEKQNDLNEQFKEFKKQIGQLEKESQQLKKPIDIPRDKLDEREVDSEQQKASEALENREAQKANEKEDGAPNNSENQNQKNATKSQKKAAKKMMEISEKMKRSMAGTSSEQMQEDAEALRQILDNLVLFSFDQEALMEQFKAIQINHNKYASFLKKQHSLKEHFEHIDDSLFALSLRQPKLSETVNKEITEVFYNIDKSLDLLAENQLYQGVSSQQFTITAANNLANFLSDVLDNMQENMSMSQGKGGQGDMQLPDIIMSQEELNKTMEDAIKKGQGQQPKKGDGENEGEGDEKGKNGKNAQEGNNKVNGKSGNSNGAESDGENEDLNGQLYEIYQQQQELRKALEERLNKEGNGSQGNAEALLKKMEEIEMDLLNKGFTNQTLQKMMDLKHQLLKMENATFQQGEENKRTSKTNKNNFNNDTNNQIPSAKQYFNTTEILNRQTLPLRQIYRKKVQAYFKTAND